MSKVVLITAQPRTASGAAVIVRQAGGGSRKGYYYQGEHWRAGVAGLPRFSAAIGFDDNGWTGGVVPTTGDIVIAPSSKARLAELAAYVWRGAAITLQVGDEDRLDFASRLAGTVVDAAVREGKLVMTVADLSHSISKPILTGRFAGTGGAEGGAEAAGRIKRRSWGAVFNVEGRILDKANNVYEFGDPSFPWKSFTTLRDKGRAAAPAPAIVAWQGSTAATFAALVASVPVQGSGVVAPSIACAKWWTQPAGPLTADIEGEIGAGYVDTAPAIAERILQAMGGPAVTNTAAMVAARSGRAGLHVDEGETIASALDRLLLGVSLLWIANPTGSITLREFSFAAPVETLRSDKAERVRTLPPIKSRRLGYQVSNRVHSDGEIAGILQVEDVQGLAAVLAGLDAAVDGKVTTFFQIGVPVAEGAGDLWFKSDTKKWYRAQIVGADEIKAGEWVLAEDAGIGVAIAAAAGAQATADGKVTTYNQQVEPTAPSNGDLWVQPSAVPKVLKRWNGTAWVAIVPSNLSELDAAAKADLDAAKSAIAAISSDAVLSSTEKPGLITRYNESIAQWTALDAKAGELAPVFDTQRNAASAAKTALVNYLAGLTPAWNNTSSNTTIVAATFQTRWSDFYNALFALDAAITGRSGPAGNDGAMAWTPVLDAAIARTGSTFRKASGGSAWAGAYSSEKAPQASASAKMTQANANFLIGLTGNPAAPGDTSVIIEHAAWCTTTGTINYWKSGSTAQAGIGTYAVGDVIGVAHRDNRIVVLKNGSVIWTDPIAVSTTKAFAIHLGLFTSGTSLDNVTMAQGGDNGIWTDLRFMRSAAAPAVPTGTEPAGWPNAIPDGTDPLWSSSGLKRLDNTLIGLWSTPAMIGGQIQPKPYVATDTYYKYQTVTFKGGTYMLSAASSTGNAPTGTDQGNAYWVVIAAPGSPGTPATPPSAFSATINLTASSVGVNLRNVADAAGYTGQSNATINFVIPAGVTITGAGGYMGNGGVGIDTGSWPTDTYAINLTITGSNATTSIVRGGGGGGGNGGGWGVNQGGSGGKGGDAIYCRLPITITGPFLCQAGGGGGGGKNAIKTGFPEPSVTGGDGGGGGAPNGSGGTGGSGDFGEGANGTSGTTAGPGNGAAVGGTYGAAGANASGGGSGGAAGYAIRKNGFAVTVTKTGTTTGTVA